MRTIPLLLFFLPFCAFSQVMDDFSDGDFTTNPEWMGTASNFVVNAHQQLQSSAVEAGEGWLSTAIAGDIMEWRFWIRQAFSPSGNNYAEVWLAADTADLKHVAKGYFLRFGAAGSQDAIELYRRDGTVETLICKGNDAAIASSFQVAVKVNRDQEGHWALLTDYDNVGNYTLEAEGFDDTFSSEGYFGFYIKYTASNGKKFYFDDVYVGPKIVDHDPPKLLSLEVQDAKHVLLIFSETLAVSALEPNHYRVFPDDVPDTVFFNDKPSQVLLGFASPLPENTNLQLQVNGISDPSGNVMPDAIWDFSIYKPSGSDVVINEIMADPTPVVGLPEWEYIELFNTTSLPINMKDWALTIGTATKTFPDLQIAPLGYLILCKDDAVGGLSAFGPTHGFSSFSIANAGTTLKLFSPNETLISEVSFNDTWYHDPDKKNGGWSLEQIDPFNPCAGTVNWSASTDVSGGTPGRENSINALNVVSPQVARVSVLDDNMILLWFDQQMDRESLADAAHYQVEELGMQPVEVICNPVNSTSVELLFDYGFQEGVVYTLLLNGVESCSGQPIAPDTRVRFGIPNEIGPGEVLINEILFDPISPGVDYVELYNHSDRIFDLSQLKLGVVKESFPNPADTVLKEITSDMCLFLPGSYVLLSTDGYTVSQQYGCSMENYLNMPSFPSYPNSGGTALLMSRQGVVVDQMAFSEKMHYPLLKETKGVALERISWDTPSDQSDNWHSAVESVHFGTPGYENSMSAMKQDDYDEELDVTPKVFSPDGDGLDDNCLITYSFEESGYTMNAYVFNVEGQMVRHLVRGELVGQEGSFVWNGLDSHGQRVPLGIYVLVAEVFTLDGRVSKYKKAVVVASR